MSKGVSSTTKKAFLWPAILCGSGAWCREKSAMGILLTAERSKVRVMFVVQLKDRNRVKDMMLILNEKVDRLSMRMALDFEVEGERKKGRLNR